MTTTLTDFIDVPKSTGPDYRMDQNRLEGFLKYASAGISIWEVDPSTKIIPALFKLYNMDIEEQYWFTFIYRVTYSTPGALYLWRQFPWKSFDKTQMMGDRMAKFREWFYLGGGLKTTAFSHDRWRAKHNTPQAIESYFHLIGKGSQEEFFSSLTLNENPEKNFPKFWSMIDNIYTFGTVTNFNYCETLHRAMGVNIDASSLMIQETWKPRKGITYLLTGNTDVEVPISKLEVYAKQVRDVAKQRFPNLGINMLIMHRLCCLYGGLAIGNRYFLYYYNRNFEETKKLEQSDPELAKVIWKIRDEILPDSLKPLANQPRRDEWLGIFQNEGRLVNIE